MKTINKQTKNIGGISKFYLLPIDQFSSLSNPDDDNLHTLVISSLDTVWEISAIYQSITFLEKFQNSHAGSYYSRKFSAKLGKDTPGTYSDLQSLRNKKWILIYQDQNGSWKITGSTDYPLRLEFSVNPGSSTADLNHYEINLVNQSPDPSRFIHKPF